MTRRIALLSVILAAIAAAGGWFATRPASDGVRPAVTEAQPDSVEVQPPTLATTQAPDPDVPAPTAQSPVPSVSAAAPAANPHRERFLTEMRRALEILRRGDPASWVEAARQIGMTALAARSADPEFLQILRREVLPALLPGLADLRSPPGEPRQVVRSAVVRALDMWDWDGTILGPDLRAAWVDGSPGLRAGILDALREIGRDALPSPNDLRTAASSDDPDLARAAVAALGKFPEALQSQDVELTARLLEAPSAEARRSGLEFIAVLRRAPIGGAEVVAALWDDPDRDVRFAALRALGSFDPRRAAQMAQERLRGSDSRGRAEAAWALLGLPSEHVVPLADALLSGLRDPDPTVRSSIANALGALPALGAQSVPALRAAVSEGGLTAYEALGSLAQLDYAGTVPLLKTALSDRDPKIRYMAVSQLAKRGGMAQTGNLLPMLEDPDRSVRQATLRFLSTHVGATGFPVDALIRALEKGHKDTRLGVIQALRGMRNRAAAAVPALERLTDDPKVGGVARNAIERIREGT